MHFQGRFTPFGEIGAEGATAPQPIVASPDKVRLFYASAPAGFALESGMPVVMAGYSHRILGGVRAVTDGGDCDLGSPSKDEVLKALRVEAWERGANAVIYALSRLSEDATYLERCSRVNQLTFYGHGVAVVLQDEPAGEPKP
jgi:hypothetical protein